MTLRHRRNVVSLAVVFVSAWLLAGCGGSPAAPELTPQEVMAKAKAHFDDAQTIRLKLSTDAVPKSGSAVLGATGNLTHQPAFNGSVKIVLSGLTSDIPVVAVDGKVHAKLPFSAGFAVIDPAEYGSPDPASFADPQAGISGLLVQLSDLAKGKQIRDGDHVLTTYTGVLKGALVAPIIPSADPSADYATTIGIDDNGAMTKLSVSGPFFAHDGPVEYDLTFSYADETTTITAP